MHSLKVMEAKKVIAGEELVDPYEVFGFGIVAYFSTLRGLMISFAVITILFMPVMYQKKH